jgi:hypothetical protein
LSVEDSNLTEIDLSSSKNVIHKLYLCGNKITSLDGCPPYTEVVDLSRNQITSLGNRQLFFTELKLNHNLIEDVGREYHEMSVLELDYNKIHNLYFLDYLHLLRVIKIRYNNITNLDEYSVMRKLEFCHFDGNPILYLRQKIQARDMTGEEFSFYKLTCSLNETYIFKLNLEFISHVKKSYFKETLI